MAIDSNQTLSNSIILDVQSSVEGGGLLVSDSKLLFSGDYSRAGNDLHITLDSTSLVVRGYFTSDTPPDLIAENGASLTYNVVSALAGPIAPGEYAQAGFANNLTKIGEVIKLVGSAQSKTSDGVENQLALGSPVFQGDVVSTGLNSKLGISFIDKSVFSMSADARMVLDELIYDPGSPDDSSMVFNLVEGAFVFVTGEIAPTGNMKIDTPVATMGIRGTTPKVVVDTSLGTAEFSILPDPDTGKVGSYQLIHKTTGAIMGTVESSGDKWVITSLSNEAVKIGKSGIDLLDDQVALEEIRDVFSRALGDRTELDGSNSYTNINFGSDVSVNGETQNNGENGNESAEGDFANNTDLDGEHDDSPEAENDAFTTGEDTILTGGVNLLDGSGGGVDFDPDGFTILVTHINDELLTFVGGTASVLLNSGAILLINPDGDITFDANDAYDFLGINDATDEVFTYTITDPGGFTASATVTITLTGRNDQPQITNLVTTQHTDAFTEAGDTGNALTTRTAVGVVNFSDLDASDSHVASIAGSAVSWSPNSGGTQALAPIGTLQILLTETAPDTNPVINFDVNGNVISVPDPVTGNVAWTFTLQENEIDFLAAGETLELTFDIMIRDGSGTGAGSGTNEADFVIQTVTITITGTNDAPVIAAVTGAGVDTGAITEIADNATGENTTTHSQTGTISFDDVDVSDTHALTSTPDAGNPADLASAAFVITQPTTTNGTTTGTFGWEFTVDDVDIDFLAVGETRVYSYTLEVDDNNGGTDTRIVTITITGTNDAPVISAATDVSETMNETEGALSTIGSFDVADVDVSDVVSITGVTLATSGNDSDPTTPLPATLLAMFSPGSGVEIDGISTTGTVNWTFDAGTDAFDYLANGENLTLTYTVTIADDNGATATQDVTITINGTNDAPTVSAPATVSIDEDTALTVAGISVADVDTSDILTVTLNAAGDLTLNGTANLTVTNNGTTTVTITGTPADINAALGTGGGIGYNPVTNFNGADTITITADDGTATPVVHSVAVTVNSVNDAPEGADNIITTNEDTAHIFQTSDFGFSDASDSPADAFSNVQITTLPSDGLLTNNGVIISLGDVVSIADITAGNLVYTPPTNVSGAGLGSFTFQVQDDGGTANGGVDLDPTPNTITIDVDASADAPTATISDPGTQNAGTAFALPVTAALTDTDGSETLVVTLSGLPNGFSVTDGTNTTISDGTNPVDISGFTLADVMVTPNAVFTGNITITATSTEAQNGDTATTTQTINLVVDPANAAPVANADTASATAVSVPSVFDDIDAILVNDSAATGGPDPTHLLLNDGSGNLSDSVINGITSRNSDVQLADFDGDGDLDAMVSVFGGANQLMTNQGGIQGGTEGTFVTTSVSGPSFNSLEVALGDLDGDGDIDAIVVDWNNPGGTTYDNTVLVNDGNGNFTASEINGTGIQGRNVALGDVDGDGDLDAMFVNDLGQNTLAINLNTGNPNSAANWSVSNVAGGANISAGVTFADVDGDGDLDALIANTDNPQTNQLLTNDGLGNFTATALAGGSRSSTEIAAGDLDGDGDIDLIVVNNGGQANQILINQGGTQGGTEGSFIAADITGSNGNSTNITLVDIDGDGDLDAVVVNNSFNNGVDQTNQLLLNDGTGNFTASVLPGGNEATNAIAFGDLDGDGTVPAVDGDGFPNIHLSPVTGSVATNDSDADAGAVLTFALDAPIAGLTLASDGTYIFDPSNSTYASLGDGQTLAVVANYTVTDNLGATDQSTLTITITGTNDAPEIVNSANVLEVARGDGAKIIDGSVTVQDVDTPNLLSATVTVSQNFQVLEDQLGFVDQNGITGFWDSLGGVLTLSGLASVADYQAALQSITYLNNSNPPTELDRQITFSVNDGTDTSNTSTTTISVSATSNIQGSPLADLLSGDGFNDAIFGLAGDDDIFGLGGNDQLTGGEGADNLTGGAGSDEFIMLNTTDGTLEVDAILDFNTTDDTINLSSFLSGSVDPQSQIEIVNSGADSTLRVDGVDVATLSGITTGEFINVIYDPGEVAILVSVTGSGFS